MEGEHTISKIIAVLGEKQKLWRGTKHTWNVSVLIFHVKKKSRENLEKNDKMHKWSALGSGLT